MGATTLQGHWQSVGRTAMNAGLVTPVLCDRDWATIARHLQLSPQQTLIARLIIEQELTSKEIARALGCTKRSVDTQIERMFKHLGIHSRVGLACKVFATVIQFTSEDNT